MTHSTPLEEHAFVSPRKKQLERDRRSRRSLIGILLAILAVGILGVIFFLPNAMPAAARKILPFLPPAEVTAIPTENIPATQSVPDEIIIDPTATLDPLPAQTQPVPSPVDLAVVPTPIGADYLQIAYASTRTGVAQIYLTNLLSDQAIPITNMPGGACQPSWSPDGTKLVFTSPCNIKKDTYLGSSLYVINADGSGLRPLPTAPGGDFEPAWSPDGQYIAFTSLRDGYMQIYSYTITRPDIRRLVKTDNQQTSPPTVMVAKWQTNRLCIPKNCSVRIMADEHCRAQMKHSFLQVVMSFPINILYGRRMVTIFSSARAVKPSLPSPICFLLRVGDNSSLADCHGCAFR